MTENNAAHPPFPRKQREWLRFHLSRVLARPLYAVYDFGTLFCRAGDRLTEWGERASR